MSVKTEKLLLQGCHVEGRNPLPIFRKRDTSSHPETDGTATPDEAVLFGSETAQRVLPYTMQDRYSRSRHTIALKTAVLENENLRAEFSLEYGGRLLSLFDKNLNRELLFKNSVFQPANLAICDAWFSGGIEWNIGQLGHTFTTCRPMYFAKMKDKNGCTFLRMYEYERTHKLFWHVDFHLPKGARQLAAYVRIVNDSDTKNSMYWWTNIAVTLDETTRVFSGSNEVFYIKPESFMGGAHRFGHAALPELPVFKGIDASYPIRLPYSTEYFYQNEKTDKAPWEAVCYGDGHVFFERSTQPLRIRKMFCWGGGEGGRRWCDFLSEKDKGNYIEVQAGLAPSQMHGYEIEANSTIEFTQLFGAFNVDEPQKCYGALNDSTDYIYECLKKNVTHPFVNSLHEKLRKYAEETPYEIINYGSGFGVLEAMRRQKYGEKDIPKGFDFCRGSITEKESQLAGLLLHGDFEYSIENTAPKCFITDKAWQPIIEENIAKHGNSVTALYHLGNILYENFEDENAISAWRQANKISKTPWVTRNLAYAAMQNGETETAIEYYRQCFMLGADELDPAFGEEYLSCLLSAEKYEAAWQLYKKLKVKTQRAMLYAGKAAISLNMLDFAESLFDKEFANIREGENSIADIWYEYTAKKSGFKGNAEDIEKLKNELSPPYVINMQMFERKIYNEFSRR